MLQPQFPSLPGLKWDIVKTPIWSTMIQSAKSGRELRSANWATPIYDFKLPYEFLRSKWGKTELQQLIGFFNLRSGSFEGFYYKDPNDFYHGGQFATGDGTTTIFQLTRTYGGHTEPTYWVEPDGFTTVPSMWSDDLNSPMWTAPGDPMWDSYYMGAFTLLSNGRVQYTTAPPAGAALYWSGLFYYRCRFKKDSYDFTNFMNGFWKQDALDFKGSLNDKV